MILKQKPRPKNLTKLSWLETSRINIKGANIDYFCRIFSSHLVHAMYRSNGAIWSSRCVPARGTAYHHRIGLTLGATTPTKSSSSSSSAAWGAGAAIAFSRATWMKFQSLMLTAPFCKWFWSGLTPFHRVFGALGHGNSASKRDLLLGMVKNRDNFQEI